MIDIRLGFKGRYKFVVTGSDGKVKLVREFSNLLTNTGADNFATSTNPFAYCLIGSGTATPLVTDTALQTFIASKAYGTVATSAQATTPYYGSLTLTYVFTGTTGTVNEVGVGPNSTNTSITSHAAVSPGITLISGDTLTVTFVLTCYSPTSDVTTNVTASTGVVTTCTVRAAAASTAGVKTGTHTIGWAPYISPITIQTATSKYYVGATLGGVTGSPTGGTAVPFSYLSMNTYVSGSKTISGNIEDIVNDDPGPVSAALIDFLWCSFQIGFSPAVVAATPSSAFSLQVGVSWTIN